MIQLIKKLFESLNSAEIRYCHWKSNNNLEQVFSGETDIDLLVDRRDVQPFLSLISSFGFKTARQPSSDETRSIYHYFGLDEATGTLVHLHAYYRIVTGGSILKNYSLPLEEMLLGSTHLHRGVKLPSKAAELALFVIRKSLEHAVLTETILLHREGSFMAELDWLATPGTDKEAMALLARWLPAMDAKVFTDSLESLRNGKSLLCRFLAARRMKKCLSGFTRHGVLKSFYLRNTQLLKKVITRFIGKKILTLFTGGSTIAIVGADATGKSTVHAEVARWLAENFEVIRVHTGKPPATFITFVPNVIIPFLRMAVPRYRTSEIEKDISIKSERTPPKDPLRLFVLALRSLMVAFDRRALLKKINRKAADGALVVCDRYPSYVGGAMDSSVMNESDLPPGASRITRLLIRMENRIYKRLPPPDIVIHLYVPVEEALKRNALRKKKGNETAEYVRRRHVQSLKQSYITPCYHKIDTSHPLKDTILEIKKIIWESL